MLRVAILNCDFIKKEFAETYGQYPEMFRHIIKKSGLTFVYESFNILEFDYPTSLNDFDLYLITGSKASVYDDEEWILNLFEFVRSLDNAKKNIDDIIGELKKNFKYLKLKSANIDKKTSNYVFWYEDDSANLQDLLKNISKLSDDNVNISIYSKSGAFE